MAKKDLSYKYDTCNCGKKKLKVSANCRKCRAAIQTSMPGCSISKPAVSSDGCCLICKTKLKPKQKAFCCLRCRFTHLRIPQRKCVGCGGTFKPKSFRSKYCTNECANRYKSVLYRNPESKMQQSKMKLAESRPETCCVSYRKCVMCKKWLTTRPGKLRYCGKKCMRKQMHQRRIETGQYVHQAGIFTCYCGRTVQAKSHANKRKACSVKCLKREHRSMRRSRIKTSTTQAGINWRSAAKRFGWHCVACKCKCITPTGLNIPNEATLDHIRPLSKGGSHTWDNVQVLCRACNIRKRDKEVDVYDSEAMTK